ncbi:MAG: hypothetical protein P8J86_10835 [Phycisphaerales bacterium]|nr:hypothetical protein [Phycisphaerales bacterium]
MLRQFIFIIIIATFMSSGCQDRNPSDTSSGGQLTIRRMPKTMTVSTQNGDVSVLADPSLDHVEILWVAHLFSDDESNETNGTQRAELHQEWSRSDHLLLEPRFFGGAHRENGMDLIVHLPDLSGLTIQTHNGDVHTRGTQGQLAINNRRGSVSVTSHVGAARLITSNGSIMVNGQVGDLLIQTSNGLVHVQELAGQPSIKATNASISLHLNEDQRGPIFLETSNAPIAFEVGPMFGGTILAETTNASIHVIDSGDAIRRISDGQSTKRITMFDAGEASHVKTTNADIEGCIEAASAE